MNSLRGRGLGLTVTLLNEMKYSVIFTFFNRHMSTTSAKFATIPGKGQTYQYLCYSYLREKPYWREIEARLTEAKANSANIRIDEIERVLQHSPEKEEALRSPDFISSLPSYIFAMKDRSIPHQLVESCDTLCNLIFDRNFGLVPASPSSPSALNFIHGWLNYFHPHFIRMPGLSCFGRLLLHRCDEVLSSQGEADSISLPDKLVHLSFLCGIGKGNLENHEVLNRIATFSSANVSLILEPMSPFDLAVICEALFKGGIRLESETSLSFILEKLCDVLRRTLDSSFDFNPFVIVSLLKILRQVSFINVPLTKLIGELILSPLCDLEKVHDIRFITNLAAAFTHPGCTLTHPDPPFLQQILARMDHLIQNILRAERASLRGKNREDFVVKSRLKDVSKWLWISATLGYQQMRAEIYCQDLLWRLDGGQFPRSPEDAVDALLALTILNVQLPPRDILRVLKNSEFRLAVKVNCSNRHKGRLGLFLTSLKLERRTSVWKQLDRDEKNQWLAAVKTPFTEKAWSPDHRKVKPLRVLGIKNELMPHTQLLNMCRDGLASLLKEERRKQEDVGESEGDFVTEIEEAVVLIGYAVPYLYIPGLKIVFQQTGKEYYLEVLDNVSLSGNYHKFKLRLMDQMRLNTFKISRESIQHLNDSNLQQVLRPIVNKMKPSGIQSGRRVGW